MKQLRKKHKKIRNKYEKVGTKVKIGEEASRFACLGLMWNKYKYKANTIQIKYKYNTNTKQI